MLETSIVNTFIFGATLLPVLCFLLFIPKFRTTHMFAESVVSAMSFSDRPLLMEKTAGLLFNLAKCAPNRKLFVSMYNIFISVYSFAHLLVLLLLFCRCIRKSIFRAYYHTIWVLKWGLLFANRSQVPALLLCPVVALMEQLHRSLQYY